MTAGAPRQAVHNYGRVRCENALLKVQRAPEDAVKPGCRGRQPPAGCAPDRTYVLLWWREPAAAAAGADGRGGCRGAAEPGGTGGRASRIFERSMSAGTHLNFRPRVSPGTAHQGAS